QVIEELGYQPNLLARSLVNQRSHTIAVVTSEVVYYVPSRILTGIDEQAEELGYSLLLTLVRDPTQVNVPRLLANLSARRVDGIIWAVHEVADNRAWFAPERLAKLPPITFLTMQERPGMPIVRLDNRAGARLVVEHLAAQGCRRIGHVSGPLDWWEARERVTGWRCTLQRLGLPNDDSLLVEGDWSATSGEQGMRTLLERNPDLDAVFAANDLIAMGALQAAHRLGRRIPEDVAVVGFDNTPEAPYFWPPLTSVEQHLSEIGRAVTSQLHKQIEARKQGVQPPTDGVVAPEPATVIQLTPTLVVRESSMRTPTAPL
ncbi:MAG: LacI family transcriptional regulator, partial [Caldilineae bacterium]